MKIEEKFKQFNKQLEPTSAQEEKVYMHIFGELPEEPLVGGSEHKSSNNFINFLAMTRLKKFVYLVFTLIFITILLGLPALYLGFNKPTQDVLLPVKQNTTSIQNLEDRISGGAQKVPSSVGYTTPNTLIAPQQQGTESNLPDSQRLKEQSGYLVLQCNNIQNVFDSTKSIINEFGGYIVTSDYNGIGDSTSSLTMRVPSDKFSTVIDRLTKQDVTVISENISTTDKQNQLDQLLKTKDIYNQKITDLQNQINNEKDSNKKAELQSQLDSYKYSLQYNQSSIDNLKAQTDFATIQVEFENKSFTFLGGDWQSIIDTAKFVIIFWTEVLLYLSIPCLIIFLLYKWITRKK